MDCVLMHILWLVMLAFLKVYLAFRKHESILNSTVKWSFISLILHYLQD